MQHLVLITGPRKFSTLVPWLGEQTYGPCQQSQFFPRAKATYFCPQNRVVFVFMVFSRRYKYCAYQINFTVKIILVPFSFLESSNYYLATLMHANNDWRKILASECKIMNFIGFKIVSRVLQISCIHISFVIFFTTVHLRY